MLIFIQKKKKMLNQEQRVTKNCIKKASVPSQNQQDNQIRESFGNIINQITRFLFPKTRRKNMIIREKNYRCWRSAGFLSWWLAGFWMAGVAGRFGERRSAGFRAGDATGFGWSA
jgi:hypothetical protein